MAEQLPALLERECGELRAAAETLILSRSGWERWGKDAFLYDRYKGVGTGTVYTTSEALLKLARRR